MAPRGSATVPVYILFCALTHEAIAHDLEFSAVPADYRTEYRAITDNPDDLERLFTLARKAEADATAGATDPAARYSFALRMYDRYRVLRPGDSAVSLRQGEINTRLGNYEAARDNFLEALGDPTLPRSIRKEARRYLAVINEETGAKAVSGSVSFGLRHQSNATAGPSEDVGGFDDLVLEDEGSDAFVAFSLTHTLDWGSQRRTVLETQVDAYASQFLDINEAGAASADLSSGPRFVMSSAVMLRPYLTISALAIGGDRYATAGGFGLETDFRTGPKMNWFADVRATYADFHESASEPNINGRDGQLYQARLEGRYALTDNFGLNFALAAEMRDARVLQESYDEYGGEIGATLAVDGPFETAAGRWAMGVTAGIRERDYENDPGRDRNDTMKWARVSLQIPVTERLDIVASLTEFDRSSTHPQFDYDNTETAVFMMFRF